MEMGMVHGGSGAVGTGVAQPVGRLFAWSAAVGAVTIHGGRPWLGGITIWVRRRCPLKQRGHRVMSMPVR